MTQVRRPKPGFEKFRSVRPRAVKLTEEALVATDHADAAAGRRCPLLMRPLQERMRLTPWAAANRDYIQQQLLRHGAILFHDFHLSSLADFEACARAISGELMTYGERSSPRSLLAGRVYTSTDHPADQPILLHNEQSYTLNWPMKIWFLCLTAAQEGGRTPIADSRRIYGRIDPKLVEKFARLGVMYVRNYGEGLGLPWQEVFQTEDRSVVEAHCRKNDIDFAWRTPHQLRTWQVRPAVRRHPLTGDPVWFNHALFFNLAGLAPSTAETLLAVVGEENLPYNTFYGDGSSIEASELDAVREAYDSETIRFPWQEGDILMVDNMLVAHGRDPFVGPRKVAVAMAEPFESMAAPGADETRDTGRVPT